MTLHGLLGFSAVVVLVGFVILAFRQGTKEKLDTTGNSHDSIGAGYGADSDGSGHGGGGEGGH